MDYSILVNKDNPLPRAYIPNTLENVHSEYKENILLDNKALEAFQELKREALRYGYHIDIVSGYRDYDYQEKIYNKLLEVDKDIVIDKNNRRRLIRALNYYKENNKSINTNTTNKLLYDAIFIGLTTDRRILYDKINNRVDIMIKDGLLNEVKAFYDKNIRTKPLLNAIGYREIYSYFDGNISLEEAINKIKQNSRHYAKRQYTFFNHQLPIVWFETDYSNFNNTIEQIISYIENN